MYDNLSVILPAFNEEENIEDVVNDIFRYVPNCVNDFEVIVINDGSTDDTQSVVDRMGRLYSNLKIVSHERNMGFGCAARTGIRRAGKEWIFIMDADGQFRIDDFGPLWMKRHGYDYILGFRKKREDNLYRFFMGRLGALISSLLLKKRIADIDCGFKLFKAEDLKALSLCSTGGAIYFEIFYNLFKNNKNRFLQCPVNHYPRKRGRQTGGRLKTIVKILLEGAKALIK